MASEMRDLTEEELKLAPEWATHYHVNHNESILFESDEKYCLYEKSTGLTSTVGCVGVCKESKPILRKTFDITKHEFSDKLAEYLFLPGLNRLCFKGDIRKQDAIAIAKVLGVTGEDLL